LFDVMYAYPLKLEDERYYKRGVKQWNWMKKNT
jgi:hypothetical protein